MSVINVSDDPNGATVTSPTASAETPTARPTAPVRRTSGLGAVLLRLHFYAGVGVAPFLVVAALTGLLYTLAPQLDQLLYGEQLSVHRVGEAARPLAEQIAAARTAHPQGALSKVIIGESETTTQVVFSLPALGDKQHTVYVDPYTAQVKGTLTTSWGSTPVTTWLGGLHKDLHLGDAGRYYSEIAASWLWVLALGGLALWWRRHRGRVTARRLLLPDLGARKGVRRTRGWHASIGVWAAIGLLVLSATGLTWSRHAGGNFEVALDALEARRPSLTTSLPGSAQPTDKGHHGGQTATGDTLAPDPAAADTVLRVARDNGLDGPVELSFPEGTATAWTAAQVDNTWPVRFDRAAIDPATSTVVARSDFADWPLLAQVSKLGIQAHMGRLLGVPNRILLAALALGLLCLIVWGYRMWWQRRPTRADHRALVGTPPARGTWRNFPAWAVTLGVLAVITIGWAIPLFGIPLAAFLLIDLVIGAGKRRRDRPTPTSLAPASGK